MATIEQVLEAVLAVNEKVTAIDKRQAAFEGMLNERCENRGELIASMHTELYGNPGGNPDSDGLKAKVQRLLNCKNTLSKSRKFWREVGGRLLVHVAGWAIVALVTWLLFLWKYSDALEVIKK
jgi:hypothetical protein